MARTIRAVTLGDAEECEKLQLAEKLLFMCKLKANLPTHSPSNKPLFWPPLA